MTLLELADYTQELLKSQQGRVDRINSTHEGVENLCSEVWLLNDLEIIQEQIETCDKIPDNKAKTLLGMTISLCCLRNPRIKDLYRN